MSVVFFLNALHFLFFCFVIPCLFLFPVTALSKSPSPEVRHKLFMVAERKKKPGMDGVKREREGVRRREAEGWEGRVEVKLKGHGNGD